MAEQLVLGLFLKYWAEGSENARSVSVWLSQEELTNENSIALAEIQDT